MARRLLSGAPMKTFLVLLAASALGCASSADLDLEASHENVASTSEALTAVSGFGANPGALNMYEYAPAGIGANAPLVVALHGCTQGAADFSKAGLNDLADKLKFYVLYPEQAVANNPVRCFNWAGEYGDGANLQRGKGENESIKEMVDKMKSSHSIDPAKVYVVGFSAGGAEAALVLATWPDVFAAGGIAAGVPYDCTTVYAEVSGCQKPGKTKTAAQWGDLVRAANPSFKGPWPRVSIWQGTADTIVGTANEGELVKQWTNVHGAPETASATSTVDGQQRQEFKNGQGVTVVERWDVQGMDHGMPIDPANGCGTAGPYLLDKKICAAAHMLEFFGLAQLTVDGGVVAPSGDGGSSSNGSKPGSGSSGSGASNGGSGSNGAGPGGSGGSGTSTSVCSCRAAGADVSSSTFALSSALGWVGLGVFAYARRRARRPRATREASCSKMSRQAH